MKIMNNISQLRSDDPMRYSQDGPRAPVSGVLCHSLSCKARARSVVKFRVPQVPGISFGSSLIPKCGQNVPMFILDFDVPGRYTGVHVFI
jgi:hypothetical protein